MWLASACIGLTLHDNKETVLRSRVALVCLPGGHGEGLAAEHCALSTVHSPLSTVHMPLLYVCFVLLVPALQLCFLCCTRLNTKKPRGQMLKNKGAVTMNRDYSNT